MDTIKIKVLDFYGNPSYYSVMPQSIFDALETAFLNSSLEIDVDKTQFNKMIEDYNLKMKE